MAILLYIFIAIWHCWMGWWVSMTASFFALVVISNLATRFFDGEWADYAVFIVVAFFLLFVLSSHVRRLHDSGRSGWWLFVGFVPIAGPIWLFILLAIKPTKGRMHSQNQPSIVEM